MPEAILEELFDCEKRLNYALSTEGGKKLLIKALCPDEGNPKPGRVKSLPERYMSAFKNEIGNYPVVGVRFKKPNSIKRMYKKLKGKKYELPYWAGGVYITSIPYVDENFPLYRTGIFLLFENNYRTFKHEALHQTYSSFNKFYRQVAHAKRTDRLKIIDHVLLNECLAYILSGWNDSSVVHFSVNYAIEERAEDFRMDKDEFRKEITEKLDPRKNVRAAWYVMRALLNRYGVEELLRRCLNSDGLSDFLRMHNLWDTDSASDLVIK